MRKIGLTILVAFILTACATSPLGRKQLAFMPEDQVNSMGAAAFRQAEQQTPQVKDPAIDGYVSCVAHAITREVGGGQWQVVVFNDKTVNAFALPGGHIGVYRGLLNVANTPDELAAVIGHEVGHVLAHHANERMSQQFAAEEGLALVQAFTTGSTSPGTQQMVMGLLGVGTQVGILLPFSRIQESEADKIGLDLMAKAGFDPQASVRLWENMRQVGGPKPPELLSTHPADETRIRDLEARMGHAMQLYQEARAEGKRPECSPPR